MSSTLTFQYTVRDRAGKTVNGTLEASDERSVASKLREMGYAPVSIKQQKTGALQKELTIPGFGPKVGLKDLSVFSRQDRKSTRLNSSHANISYAVFCLKKKNKIVNSNFL